MTLETGPSLVVALLFVVPGFVYQLVRDRLRGVGIDARDDKRRFARALVVSTCLISFYIFVGGGWLVGLLEGWRSDSWSGLQGNSRLVAGLGFVLLIAVPALVAFVEFHLHRRRRGKEHARFDPTPTAWDWGMQRALAKPGYVRVLTASGVWVAGYVATGSHATSYPESPALWIERSHYIDTDGVIGPRKPDSRGVWVSCEGATVVELLDGSATSVDLRDQELAKERT